MIADWYRALWLGGRWAVRHHDPVCVLPLTLIAVFSEQDQSR